MFALMLTACHTTPPTPTARPQAQPIADNSLAPAIAPELTPRQRIVAIAEHEWRSWGSQTVLMDANGRGCVSNSPLPPPPEYLAAQAATASIRAGGATLLPEVSPCWQFADGSGMESTPQGCALTLRYWRVLGREPECAQIATARWAWSAAFISWVMRQAGLTNEQFLTGEAHNMYVADARDELLPAAAFGIEPYPAVPAAGDMICSVRSAAAAITDVEQIVFGRTPMHCDIVITVNTQQHSLLAIGGNVQQSVSLSVISWAAPSAPPEPDMSGSDDIGDATASPVVPWLLVMRNHLQ
ncbi:MAG TPA: DUF2272 domain-containing protein [Rhodocyclaceae bacterium]|nr:DUF2272 domain-containing protein [Rhodocyclaceae bacterium]